MVNKKIFILLFISVLPVISVLSQGAPPAAPCWPPPCVPIDGGITIFSIIAAAFGYRFLSKNK